MPVPMATLSPFRALRPPPTLAARVASPPYDVVSTKEARALARGNADSFLRVSRPEIDLPHALDHFADGLLLVVDRDDDGEFHAAATL